MKKLALALLVLAPLAARAQGPRGTTHIFVEQTPNPTQTPGIDEVWINGPKSASGGPLKFDLEITGPCTGSVPYLTVTSGSPNPEIRCAFTPTATATATATPTPTITPTPGPTNTPTPTATPSGGSGSLFLLAGGTSNTMVGTASFPVSGQGPDFGDGNGQDDQDEKILYVPASTPSKLKCSLFGGLAESGKDHVFTLRRNDGGGSRTSTDWSCTITSANNPAVCTDTSGSALTEGYYYFRDVVGGSPVSAYLLSCYLTGTVD